MSDGRLSAEREQEIRDMLGDPWTSHTQGSWCKATEDALMLLDAVRADLAQARKERDRALLAWGDASAAFAAAREALERIAGLERSRSGRMQGIAREALAGGGGDPT